MSLNGGRYWWAHYNDRANDLFAGNDAANYASYTLWQPAAVTNAMVQTANHQAIMVHHLMLTRSAAAADLTDWGQIFLCHRLTHYKAMIGQPKPFDNRMQAFVGSKMPIFFKPFLQCKA